MLTIQPLAVQVDDVCGYGIPGSCGHGRHSDCGGPCLRGSQDGRPVWEGNQLPNPRGLRRGWLPQTCSTPGSTHLQIIQPGWPLHPACWWVLKKQERTCLGLKGWRTGNLDNATLLHPKSGCRHSNSPSNSSRSGPGKNAWFEVSGQQHLPPPKSQAHPPQYPHIQVQGTHLANRARARAQSHPQPPENSLKRQSCIRASIHRRERQSLTTTVFRAKNGRGHSPGGLLLHFGGKAKPSKNN